jgi:hypothetical protein
MIDELLRDADPARGLDTDSSSPQAQALLARVLALPPQRPGAVHRLADHRSVRRIAIGGLLAGAAATVALAAPLPWDDGAGTTGAAFAVTAEAGGAVRVSVHWEELSDPAALQTALDRAGARIKIRIETATGSGLDTCPAGRPVDYSDRAVQYLSPGSAGGGFLVRPKEFPPDATFVLTVTMAPAGVSGLSTMPPGRPQIESWGASMISNPVPPCH